MADDKRPEPQQEAEADTAEPAETQSGGEDRIKQLEAELAEARAKAEENWDKFARASAEAENIRRRGQRELEQAHKYGTEKLAGDLLAIKDSLEMGVQAAKEPGADVAKLREGSELTLKMLSQALERHNIQELDPQGEKFDPARHEAMAMQPTADQEPNTVVTVVQKGYLLNDRLLRPAMVVVAKPTEESSGGQIDEQA